jgi:hypothetical protein
MATVDTPNSNSNSQSAADVPNSPNLGSDLKPRCRAVKDEKQLEEIIKRLEQENSERNKKNARIMAKYNAERPHRPSELKAEGLDWMSNFASQPLSTLIDRIAPRFSRALNSCRYLTSAKLRDDIPNSAAKTEKFRAEFTRMVRNRVDWKDLLSEIAQENSCFGYTLGCFTDEYDWFPRHFRQDEFFVLAETKQNSKHCPILIVRETFLPHELFEKIEDKESAELAGWDIEETVKAINKATPDSISKSSQESARRYEDLQRESNLFSSLANGAKVIVGYHAFVTELTGRVSHYIVDGKSYKWLFCREDRFKSMEKAAHFFSFQQANGKLQASKGVGRTVYALAGIVDRARNEVINRLQLSGKIIVQGDEKANRSFKMSVIGQAIVIAKEFQISQNKIDAGVEPFMELDGWIQHLMDEIAGNVSPAAASEQLQGERVTNGQINYLADLQNEAKDAKIERFCVQAASLLSEMQVRAANPEVQDEAAREFRSACLTIMTEEELQALAKHPAAGVIEDFTDRQRQVIVAICTEMAGDPLLNQKELRYRKLAAAVDADFAKAVLLPDEDPTVQAEQTRIQAIEDVMIGLGKGKLCQPSPRDNHIVHLTVMMQDAEEVAGTVAQDPNNATILQGYLEHGQAHLQMAAQMGVPEGQLQQFSQQLMQIQQGLQHMAEAAQQQMNPGQVQSAPIEGAAAPAAAPAL